MEIIGIDIGGTNFRIGLVSEDGTVSDFRKVSVKEVFSSPDPLKDLISYLRSYCADKIVDALAIGFPATLDAHRKTVLQAPNIPFMENLPVVDVLRRELEIPVFIERDVTMTMEYDCHENGISAEGIVCGFYFGTGVGNAISICGVPLIGRDGTAGELGHIPVDGNDLACGCGNIGCMETVAGGRYLAYLCGNVFDGTHVSEIFTKHGKEPILRQFVDRMAMAVATEVNILNPNDILIGGGVPSMADFPKDYLLEQIMRYTRKPLPADNLRIVFTEDMETKSVIGAARYCKKKML